MIFNNDYYHLPPREIDQTIIWLETVVSECEQKIRKLQSLKNADQRQRRHIRGMNDLADMFDHEDYKDMPDNTLAEIIRQRLGCDYKRSYDLIEILKRRARKRAKKRQQVLILELHSQQKPVTEIAKTAGVSRPTVYAALNKAKEEKLI